MGPAPIKGADARFAFVEISGAPRSHVLEFNRAIDTEAKTRNLNLVPEGDPSATYLVKGYLSAIGDHKGTLLIYVWDVLDVGGKRLYRISGQESAGGSTTDPWLGIDRKDVDLWRNARSTTSSTGSARCCRGVCIGDGIGYNRRAAGLGRPDSTSPRRKRNAIEMHSQ